MQQNLPTLLTVAEAADALGISIRSVQRRIASGALPARKIGAGGTAPYVVDRGDVERLRDSESVSPTP